MSEKTDVQNLETGIFTTPIFKMCSDVGPLGRKSPSLRYRQTFRSRLANRKSSRRSGANATGPGTNKFSNRAHLNF